MKKKYCMNEQTVIQVWMYLAVFELTKNFVYIKT